MTGTDRTVIESEIATLEQMLAKIAKAASSSASASRRVFGRSEQSWRAHRRRRVASR